MIGSQNIIRPNTEFGKSLAKLGYPIAKTLSLSQSCSKTLKRAWECIGSNSAETYRIEGLIFSPISFSRFTESLKTARCRRLILTDITFKTGSLSVHIPNLLQRTSSNSRIRHLALNRCQLSYEHAYLIACHLQRTDLKSLDLTENALGLEEQKLLLPVRMNQEVTLNCDPLNREDQKTFDAYIEKL